MADLVNWYMGEFEKEIELESELVLKQRMITKIIHRLINVDHVLVSVRSTVIDLDAPAEDGGADEENPLIFIHPNYVRESDA